MFNRPSSFRPFRHGGFRDLWIGVQLSNFGTMVHMVGAAWAMTLMTDSPTLIALVQASNTLPMMVFAMLSGALADSHDRLRMILIAQSMMAVLAIGLTVVAFAGGLTPWVLLGFSFLIGTGMALHNPSWQASMGDLVPRSELPEAVTLNAMGFNLMRSIGPAVGGLVVATLGAPYAFGINVISYLPLWALLVFRKPVRVDEAAAPPGLPGAEPLWPALWAGLRYFIMSPNIVRVTLRAALFGLGSSALLALLPLVAAVMMQGGSTTFGALLGCFGAGAIGAAFLNPWLRARVSNERIVEMAHGIFAMSLVILAVSPWFWLSLAVMVPAGACWVMALSLLNVSVQLAAPRWVVGRALSIYQTALFGGMTVGAWLWGALAGGLGVPAALALAAGVLVAGIAVGLILPVPDFARADLTPARRLPDVSLRLDLRGRSGPIMIMVDYIIDKDDVPEFLRLMAQRRQSRRRDGARNWALLRDLEQPEIWSESFHLATWDDYLRHVGRRTRHDTGTTERLHQLHRGDGPPRVHRMIERHSISAADDLPWRAPPA